ncbi:MAG: hypothetical protein OZ928_05595 [Polyangiaceae bacterium]|nr:hypothetical protein [Polyangiaceae bacterium]
MGRKFSVFHSLLVPSALLAAGLSWSPASRAQPVADGEPRTVPPPPPPSDQAAGTAFESRLVLDTGRAPVKPPASDLLEFQIHGEYQVRAYALTDLPLAPFGLAPDSAHLGQTVRVLHWLRLTPRLDVGAKLAVVAQLDVPSGFFAGQETLHVDAADEPYDQRNPLRLAPRWLYLDWKSPIGLFRVGQQPSHWGMGIIANDGDHPRVFGDYRGGSRVERLLFATRPGGESSPFNVAVAGDLVFKDQNADLLDGERAWQGVVAAFYENRKEDMVGLYGVYRHQTRDGANAPGFTEKLEVWGVDSSGRYSQKIPGDLGHVFGEYEVAYLFGSTDFVRTVAQTSGNERERLSQLGAAARLGAVLTSGAGDERFGRFVSSLEWGYASGDADPNDGTTRRFTFDPNHTVGLILFSEALAWKTARAASAAQDPRLVARPNPGTDLLPSNGGVFGATYLNPTFIVRPVRQLDLKAGAVLAQTTADFVDPVRLGTTGQFRNYDGGSARSRDLGLELDLGVEYRLALEHGMTLQLGAQGGALFPGGAFDDASGNGLGTQYLGVGRLGLQY